MYEINPMADPTADKIAGALLCQELLVRHLEECGVLERGSFRLYLEAHMTNLAGKERHQPTYGPMRALIAALDK
jgi:hypothetical protein